MRRELPGIRNEVGMVQFLDAFAKLRKATINYVMSTCVSAWNNWAPTGRILMKLDIWDFLEYKLRKFKSD